MNLTQGSFDHLLAAFDPDRDRAGAIYEELRDKLVRFFEWRGTPNAEELADMTMDRVAQKLTQGEVIREANPALYIFAVAQNILREHWKSEKREHARSSALQLVSSSLSYQPDFDERTMRCLERCVSVLETADRALIFRYYEGEQRAKIDNRRLLAEELALPLNALRIRVHRLRVDLEKCLLECLKEKTE